MSWVEVALLGAVIASLVISFVAILVAVGAKFRLTQLEQDQTATELLVSKLKGQVYGVVEGGGLLSRQAEVEQLLDMLIDCQDQVEDELYGDGEGRKGLRQKFEELWNKVHLLEGEDDIPEVPESLLQRIADREGKPIRAQFAIEQPEKCCKEDRREERCLAGLCQPTDCEREQCPHRTQEFVVEPYTGILKTLDGFSGEWDQVLEKGQVTLTADTEAEGRQPNSPLKAQVKSE